MNVFFTITFSNKVLGAHSRHREMVKQLANKECKVIWIGPSASDLFTFFCDDDKQGNVTFIKSKFNILLKFSFVGKFLFSWLNCLLFRVKYYKCKYTIKYFAMNHYLYLGMFFSFLKKGVFFCRMDLVNQHSTNRDYHNNLAFIAIYYFYAFIQLVTLYLSNKYIVQTEILKRDLKARYKSITCSKMIYVLPNNILKKPRSNLRHPFFHDKISIGFLSNMNWNMKGLEVLSVFCNKCDAKKYKIQIAGIGFDLEKLKSSITNKDVLFCGKVNGQEFLEHIDILLVTSIVDYCPNVVLEALNLNIPIVASRIPVHEYLLGKYHVGLFNLDVDDIAQEIDNTINKVLSYRTEVLAHQKQHSLVFDFDWGAKVVLLLKD